MSAHTHIVTAQALQSRLGRSGWRVLDCRSDLADPDAGHRSYLQGHIPGALFIDLESDLSAPVSGTSGRHPLPAVATVSQRLGELGIDSETGVVVYDANTGAIASRAWWTLRWLGHSRVFLLDGGIDEWLRQGLEMTAGEETAAPRTFEARPRDRLVLTTAEIAADMAAIPAMNLIDAREPGRFLGKFEPIDPVAGHIPGAVSLPFAESLNPDQTWRSRGELNSLWERYLGTDRQVDWAVMCGSGVTACHLAVSGLEAGYREPRLYAGSWSEWIREPGRPIAVGEGGSR